MQCTVGHSLPWPRTQVLITVTLACKITLKNTDGYEAKVACHAFVSQFYVSSFFSYGKSSYLTWIPTSDDSLVDSETTVLKGMQIITEAKYHKL